MTVFPFSAVLGQDELKTCLLLNAVDPGVGGVLALGDRGTGKSTTVRALGRLLDAAGLSTPVVDLPLGATEDRVLGTMDVSAALVHGERRFSPGLLADADGGFLYVDEVNLLDDFLVDVLLDVAASGVNRVERDGISHSHPARFVLVGSGNPEEGDLRPQLEDRFGLSTHVSTIMSVAERAEIVRRRLAFDADPESFVAACAAEERELGEVVARARTLLAGTTVDDDLLDGVVRLCVEAGAVGHRGEIVLVRAARAHAALRGAPSASGDDVDAVARAVLRHRASRESFETVQDVEARLDEILP